MTTQGSSRSPAGGRRGGCALTAIGLVGDLYLARIAGGAMMVVPGIRQYGVSLFASAGAAGIVVGLAARPLLSNLLAGIQIAITQPVKIAYIAGRFPEYLPHRRLLIDGTDTLAATAKPEPERRGSRVWSS